MDDRELLELAAKAAGGEISTGRWNGGALHIYTGEKSYTWNPLTDDGDAMRLFIELQKVTKHLALMVGQVDWTDDFDFYYISEDGGSAAATRRAIVRAAAEIAKAIP